MSAASSKPMILNTAPEAATLETLTGWVSRNRHFYGDNEQLARWDGCTHVACEVCGTPCEKGWLRCGPCREKLNAERWAALPLVEWDGDTPFCLDDGDHYFFDENQFYDWLDDQTMDTLDGEEVPLRAEDVRLVLCEPRSYRQVDSDYWYDDAPEDWDGHLPDKIQEALDALNAAIAAHKEPAAWCPGKQRIVMPTRTEAP